MTASSHPNDGSNDKQETQQSQVHRRHSSKRESTDHDVLFLSISFLERMLQVKKSNEYVIDVVGTIRYPMRVKVVVSRLWTMNVLLSLGVVACVLVPALAQTARRRAKK